ncbi:MAG: toxin-antitoxin system YwqK family antitoxin [Verrucomicrobiota bacterium]
MKNGIERTFHPNGQVRSEIPYINGVVHGLSQSWHANGLLAHEIPMVHGQVEGVARFWNEKGTFLGSYEIRNGTGIQKIWFPNGKLMGEVPLIDGMMTGRQIAFFEDGTIAAETYYIRNQRVSKKKYLEMCTTDPTLPRYAGLAPEKASIKKKKEEAMRGSSDRTSNSFFEELLNAPSSQEVLAWLRGGINRILGEMPSNSASIEFVEDIYSLGAAKVTAVKPQEFDTQETTSQLVITLPFEANKRARLFKWYEEQARALGFCGEADSGQRHLLLMLD